MSIKEDATIVEEKEIVEDVVEEVEEAVDEGVEEEQEYVSPRQQALNEINKRRREELKAEGIIEEDPDTPSNEVFEIDGEEVSLENLIRDRQKMKAGDKKLEDASKLMKEIQEKEDALLAKEEEIKKMKEDRILQETQDVLTSDKEEGAIEEAAVDDDIDFTELSRLIREGDDDEAEDALKQLVKSVSHKDSQSFSEEAIVKAVHTHYEKLMEDKEKEREEQTVAIAQKEADAAEEVYKVEFKADLKASDKFYDITVMEYKRLLEEDEWVNKSYEEKFRESGERARKWFSPTNVKLKRKQKITSLSPVGSGSTILEDEKPPVSSEGRRSDIIKNMAKRRGQAI